MTAVTTTVIGADGFIGGALTRRLQAAGVSVVRPGKGERLDGRPLGTLFYCAGVTGDFRARVQDTIEAHVLHLADVVRSADIQRLIYLSSARVYRRAASTAEDAAIRVESTDPDQLYDISKLMGEAVCALHPNAVMARLAHVFGNEPYSPNFLSSLIRGAVDLGRIQLATALSSSRDYVSVDDVVTVLTWLRDQPFTGVLNIASGQVVSHQELVSAIVAGTGASVDVAEDAPVVADPAVEIDRLRSLLPEFRPRHVVTDVDAMVLRARSASP